MQCHKPSPKSQFLWVQLQPSPHGSCSWQPGFPTLIIRITIPTPFIIIIKLFNAIILIKKLSGPSLEHISAAAFLQVIKEAEDHGLPVTWPFRPLPLPPG